MKRSRRRSRAYPPALRTALRNRYVTQPDQVAQNRPTRLKTMANEPAGTTRHSGTFTANGARSWRVIRIIRGAAHKEVSSDVRWKKELYAWGSRTDGQTVANGSAAISHPNPQSRKQWRMNLHKPAFSALGSWRVVLSASFVGSSKGRNSDGR